MKKATAVILVLAMLAAFAACGKKQNEENQVEPGNDPVGPVAGGWTVNTEFSEAKLPEEAKAAFDAAVEGLEGAKLEPVAYLGSQVVAGLNYAFLCKSTPVVPDAKSVLVVVTVYRDLEGKSTITNTSGAIDLLKYANVEGSIEFPQEGFVGGYNFSEACGAGLDEKCQAAFDKALEGLDGMKYDALVNLGSQVVAGSNYAVLAKATLVTPNPQSALAVLTIYDGVDGTQELLSVTPFSISQE